MKTYSPYVIALGQARDHLASASTILRTLHRADEEPIRNVVVTANTAQLLALWIDGEIRRLIEGQQLLADEVKRLLASDTTRGAR